MFEFKLVMKESKRWDDEMLMVVRKGITKKWLLLILRTIILILKSLDDSLDAIFLAHSLLF